MSHEKSHKSYRPLCILTFRFNYFLHELNPAGYHIFNVILHMIACILVYKLSISLTLPPVASLISSLIFSIHPIHVEAVTGVVGRAELLSSIFYMLAIIIFISFSIKTLKSSNKFNVMPSKNSNFLSKLTDGKLLIVVVLIAAATLSKEQGITAVGICCIWEIFSNLQFRYSDFVAFGRLLNKTSTKYDSIKHSIIQIFIITSLTSVLLFARLKVMGVQLPIFTQFDNPGAVAENSTRYLTHIFMLPLNMWLMLCPSWLCCDWTMGTIPLLNNWFDPRNFASLAFIISALIFAYQSFVKKWPIYLPVTMSLIILPFLPASNLFFPVGFVVAERVLYMPSIGFCILVAAGFEHLINSLKENNFARRILWLLMLSLMAFFCAKTIWRNFDWKNEMTLFVSAVRINRQNAKLFNNVGHALEAENKHQAALRFFKRAALIQPDDMGAHINVGRTQVTLGQYSEAEQTYMHAMKLLPPVKSGQSYTARLAPNHLNIFINYANLISKNSSRLEEAEYLLRNGISMRSDFIQAYMNRADILIRLNRSNEAMAQYETALKYEPSNPDIHYNMAIIHLEAARQQQALIGFEKALELDPQHRQSLFNSAILLQELATGIQNNKTSKEFRHEALKRLQLLTSITPQDEKVYFNIALIQTDLRDLTKARHNFEISVQLKPDFRAAQFNLALLISNDMHRPLEAITHLDQLLKYYPHHTNALILLGDILVNHVKDFNAAEKTFLRILTYEPTNLQARHNLCVVYVEKGLLIEAERCLSNLVIETPKEAYIQKHLNIVRQRINQQLKNIKHKTPK